jgi:hypothetical protein
MIKVISRIYKFNEGIPIKERSLFNKNRIEFGRPINLYNYIVNPEGSGLNKLTYTKPITDKIDNLLTLVGEAGSLMLELSGIKDNGLLIDYFNIYDTTNENKRRIYEIEVYYNDTLIWLGSLNRQNIETNHNNDIIKIQALSIEKEFKNYFSEKLLPSHDEIFINNPLRLITPWYYSEHNYINREASLSLTIKNFLKKLLGNMFYIDCPTLEDWEVNNIPQFYLKGGVTNFWFIKSGYTFFEATNNKSIYKLLEHICNAMGWQFYVSKSENKYIFILKNRSEFTGDLYEIDFKNNVINYNVLYTLVDYEADYIIIKEGLIRTGIGYQSQGITFAMISDRYPAINEGNFFSYVIDNTSAYNLYPYAPYANRYQYENAGTATNFDWAEIYYTGSSNWSQRSAERKIIESDKILYLDAGNHEQKCFVNNSNKWNGIWDGNALGQWSIGYQGNAGSMLFKRNSLNTNYIQTTYNDYIKSQTFKNNFAGILNAMDNQLIEIELQGVIYRNNAASKFYNNYGDFRQINFFANSEFAILESEINLINNTSKLKLLRK